METKKQTAVQWLIQKLTNRQNGVFDGLPHLSVDEIYNQALEMEKEQRIKFTHDYLDDDADVTAEQYYKETYGE